MKKADDILLTLSKEAETEIKEKVRSFLYDKDLGNQVIKDNIFSILEKVCKVLYFPIDDDEICAFYRKVNDTPFVFINTAIPYEKQVFAAAHELAHLWGIGNNQSEVLQNSDVYDFTESNFVDHKNHSEELANRLAAELLVEEKVLQKELNNREIHKNKVSLKNIVELMDVFLVPYKTIVRRLYEINYIDDVDCMKLLAIPARGKDSEIIRLQMRYELCMKNNQRDQRKKLTNFLDLSLKAYEQHLRTFVRLTYLLSRVDRTPDEFGIKEVTTNMLSETELEKLLDDDQ